MTTREINFKIVKFSSKFYSFHISKTQATCPFKTNYTPKITKLDFFFQFNNLVGK